MFFTRCTNLSMLLPAPVATRILGFVPDTDMLCSYLGEWFDASDEALYGDKRSAAMSNCWVVGAIYLGIALLCCVGFVYHKLRRNI